MASPISLTQSRLVLVCCAVAGATAGALVWGIDGGVLGGLLGYFVAESAIATARAVA